MGGATVKPHIKHIKHLAIGRRIIKPCKDTLFKAVDIPHIGTIFFELGQDAGIHGRVLQNIISICRQSACFNKTGQRYAPSALTRQDPIRARLDHRVKAVAACLRRPRNQFIN